MADIRKQTGVRGPTQGQFTKPGVQYPSPDILNDVIIIERKTVDSKEEPIAYQTPHPADSSALLVKQSFEAGEDNKKTRTRVFARYGTNAQQDVHNAAFKYSANSHAHKIVVRSYNIPDAIYAPVATGTEDSQFTGCYLVLEEAVSHPEFANYQQVTRVFEKIPGPALGGKIVTGEGQLGTLTRQTVAPGTTVTPDALMVSGSVQPDGAGKSVLETVVVPSVFPETQKSASQPTKIPEMFFSSPVTQESSVAAGTDTTPVVGSGGLGVIEQSKQAVTAHKVKTTTTTAPASTGARTGLAYDESLHISVGYTREVVQGTLPSSLADATPVGPATWITELKDHEAAQDALDAIYVVSPSIERIQLPDTLVSVDCIWNPTKADATMAIQYGGPEPSEESTLEEQLRDMVGAEFSLNANAAITGDFNVKIKEGFAEPVTVELHSFYLPFTSGELTKAAILAKINAAISPDEVAAWPAYRKESDTIVLTGMEKSVRRACKIIGTYDAVEGDPPVSIGNRVMYIVTDSSSVSSSVKALHLPPTIHGEITITETGSDTITGKATDFAEHVLEAVVTGTLSTSTIAATSMEEFPTGRFLYDVDIKPIEFGYARVMATVVEITEDMV